MPGPIFKSIIWIASADNYKIIVMKLLLGFVILAAIMVDCKQHQLYYLTEAPAKDNPSILEQLENNPYNVPFASIDCAAYSTKCSRFKHAGPFPYLVYWPGPGNGYKLLGAPTVQTLTLFFSKIENHPLKPLRTFLENISFVQCLALAFVLMIVLHWIFTFLFKDRLGSSTKAKEA